MKKISFFGLRPASTSEFIRDGLPKNKAQVSLELIGSLLVCLILIVGITRVFVWLNQCLVNRQYEYQDTRKPMRDSSDVVEDFYTPEDLSVVR